MKKDPATGASLALVKWRHWPESAATWERSARIPQSRRAQLMDAYRNSVAARVDDSIDNGADLRPRRAAK
jgi:hypothetical protein